MTRIVTMLIAVLVAAAVAAPMAEAQSRKKKKRAYTPLYAGQGYAAARNNGYEYKEFIAEKHPIGSNSWWEQMDREGRGGQSRAN